MSIPRYAIFFEKEIRQLEAKRNPPRPYYGRAVEPLVEWSKILSTAHAREYIGNYDMSLSDDNENIDTQTREF